MRVAITRIDAELPLPCYGTSGSAGLDLYCRLDTAVESCGYARIPANVIVEVPAGYVLAVVFRSSTPERLGLVTPNGIGVVDPDYHGRDDEIKILVYNPSDEAVVVRRGDRVAQALLLPVERIEWEEQDVAPDASRGGFGSTD